MNAAFNFETLRLQGGERMGLLGASLLLSAGERWWLGPAVYGAATGQRGGLFVLGGEVQRRWPLAAGQLVAGLFAGGGGGAAAAVGGGLMLRPSLAWLADLGPVQAGLGVSAVRFPSGDIASRQLALLLAWDGRFRYALAERAGSSGRDAERSGAGVDRLVMTFTRYALRGYDAGARGVWLVGARGERDFDPAAAARGGPSWHWGIETAGAAGGGAAGYMEILGLVGWRAPLSAGGALQAGWHASAGLGGGGAVPTAGGAIAKAALSASLALSPRVSTGVEAGWLRALDSRLHSPFAQWTLAVALEGHSRGATADQPATATFARTEWSAALQHNARAARNDGSTRSLDAVGMKIARYAGENLYLTVQAHSAYAGGAGAYSMGLVGAGVARAARGAAWRAGFELLAGAGAGGGVASAGGALVQGLAWVGLPIGGRDGGGPAGGELELRIGAGAVRSRQPGLASPVIELSITRAFAQLVP
jgi:hypothetical protein